MSSWRWFGLLATLSVVLGVTIYRVFPTKPNADRGDDRDAKITTLESKLREAKDLHAAAPSELTFQGHFDLCWHMPCQPVIDEIAFEMATTGAYKKIPDGMKIIDGKVHRRLATRPGEVGSWEPYGPTFRSMFAWELFGLDDNRIKYDSEGGYYLRHDVAMVIRDRLPHNHLGTIRWVVRRPPVDEAFTVKPDKESRAIIWDATDKCWRYGAGLAKVDPTHDNITASLAIQGLRSDDLDAEAKKHQTTVGEWSRVARSGTRGSD